MTAVELLASLQQRGFTLAVADGDSLTLAPKVQVTPELRETVRRHKAELLALLRPQNFDDVKAGVRRLERQMAEEADLAVFLLVIHHSGDPDPPEDLETRLFDQARAGGLTGRLCVVLHSPHYQCELWQTGNGRPH